MDTTYHIKDLAELADHFAGLANSLLSATPKRKSERMCNEAAAIAYQDAAATIRRTKLETS